MERIADRLMEQVRQLGADHTALVDIDRIPFDAGLRKACELNYCGGYGKNWMCPPHAGEVNELISQAKRYNAGIVFQKVYAVEDSFDIEGMTEAMQHFRGMTNEIASLAKGELSSLLVLSAGQCCNCARCAVLDDLPCVDVENAYSSLECYGMHVSDLARICGMKYINGENTVTYFGILLTKDAL
ncbi:MAG: DUF2284 domain-containing protein [Christensenellales bacterium]|jgi:predicted metal-binding protein